MRPESISSWQDIGLRDLFFAYRKSKADCFFERSICISRQFAEFESQLPTHLTTLLNRLHAGEIEFVLAENVGAPRVVAKKLGMDPKKDQSAANPRHGFFSSPERAFDHLLTTHELNPQFRLVGDFPVVMHLLSALWINLVGHKFDAVILPSAYGSRLRRFRAPADSPRGTVGEYHLEAIGSFQPYFAPYKAWREGGIQAIRRELEADQSVVAVSMDLASFYHKIDPAFLSNQAFLDYAGINLTPWELGFTSAFVNCLAIWSERVTSRLNSLGCNGAEATLGGLPIGLSLSRVAANVLLTGLDRDITQGIAPVYYGRYVDDLFLVIKDPGTLDDAKDLLPFLAARTSYFPKSSNELGAIELILPSSFKGNTSLSLQHRKQKTFFLQGQGGLDLMDNIESQIRSVSSERRLMPSPDRLEKMASAQVLTAAANAAEEVDTLRRADGLEVRRLGWSVQLRAVETLAKDLRASDWQKEREQFYNFAHNHILRPDRILDHIDYLPRLLSIAVALTDWAAARRLVDASLAAIDTLERYSATSKVQLNGIVSTSPSSEIWLDLKDSVRQAAADAISRSIRWSGSQGGMRPLSATALSLCEMVGLGQDAEHIHFLSRLLRESDWSKTSFKDHLRRDAQRHPASTEDESIFIGIYPHESDLLEFLTKSAQGSQGTNTHRIGSNCKIPNNGNQRLSLVPYLFPTRPYTPQEIALFLPDACIFSDNPREARNTWARFVRAVRGVWVRPGSTKGQETEFISQINSTGIDNRVVAVIGSPHGAKKVVLGISSLFTSDKSFREAASGTEDISRERYRRIETVINHALSVNPKPTHLLLPELSLPERWVSTVSGLLRDAGISLIAGLDYRHSPPFIHSEALLVLSDDRLGFPSSVQIRQPKSQAAAGEEEHLLRVFGKTWVPSLIGGSKPVYSHQGFCFGVLVCSELQNIEHRRRFQGDVDCMMVLSWNPDLETFSALVEAASLDVHAHIALVNNRKYGDSRVRSPAKAHHNRDLCRLRGGENDYLVVVELDVDGLRAFQSRSHRWPTPTDPYKPVPEGFKISSFRRTIPR